MKDVIKRLIEVYGNDMTIRSDSVETQTRAFFQLVTSKSWQNMERMIPSIGEVPRGQFLYLGPTEVQLKAYDSIKIDGRTFLVRRADAIWYRSDRIFIWGLCVEGGGE